MSHQSHGTALARDQAGAGGTPTVGAFRIVLLSTGVYGLMEAGAPSAAIVESSAGIYTIDTASTVGDLDVASVGTTGVLY